MIPIHNSYFCLLPFPAPRLPDWIGLVVTSRPESNVIAPLQGLNPVVLDTRAKANCASDFGMN